MQQGKSFPITISIVPHGTDGIKMTSTGTSFFCHPSEQTVCDGNHIRIDWAGPAAGVPQTSNLTTTSKCAVDVELVGGNLKGTHVSTTTTIGTFPGLVSTTATARVKNTFDVARASQVPESTPAPSEHTPTSDGLPEFPTKPYECDETGKTAADWHKNCTKCLFENLLYVMMLINISVAERQGYTSRRL
ncbi:MAG: hypothetical protein HQM16_13400 [Deltaproteobacteria bacterium]|nr:hypothetical protein [Deltaproteobacteria bacterium]